jgi:hypothetical protein
VIAISTSAEAGLPRESMSGGHLLPFRVPRHAGEEGAAVVAPLASVPHQAIASPLNDSASPSYLMDAVWLSLLRRRDGAVLQLSGASSPLELRSSSGLTGSAGARKSLTLLFESEDDEYAQLKPPTPRGGRRSLKHDLSRRGISAQRGHQPVRVALRYALLPKAVPSLATLPGVTGAEDEGTGGGASPHPPLAYEAPFLESVELRSLPFRDYWQVEDEPDASWERPPTDESMRSKARASGVNVLADAWAHPGVLAALIAARVRAPA